MADQGTASFVTGLANSLNSYLGTQYQAQAQSQRKMDEMQTRSQLDIGKEVSKQAAELEKGKQLEQYKQGLEGQVTPDMAEQLIPGSSQWVQGFQKQNNRYPTVNEAKTGLEAALKQLGGETKQETHQDKLEKEYADRLQKVVSFRSGGLGLQDSKVNQAIDLRTLLNQYYDPKTDTYNVPPAQHSESALGLARLVSPQGTVPIELEKQIRQSTGREALSHALIYMGADPAQVGGPTQSVVKMFKDSVDRQGETAERIRDQYIQGLKGLKPGSLSQDRADRLNKAQMTSSYTDFLKQSPGFQKHMETHEALHPVGRVTVIGPTGQRGTIPAEQLDAALKAGYKQAQ